MMKAIAVNMNTIKITREPGLWTFSRSLKCGNLVIIGHGLSWFSGPRRWALSIGTPAAFYSNLSLISCLIFGSGWSHVRLSLAWESLQKRDNSALNSFQGRLLCRVETAHHLEVPGVYYRRDNQRVERLALEWTGLFFKSRTSFKRLSIPLLVESMKVEKKTLIVSSWTFRNSLTKPRGTRLSPFTFVLEVFSVTDFKRVFAI